MSSSFIWALLFHTFRQWCCSGREPRVWPDEHNVMLTPSTTQGFVFVFVFVLNLCCEVDPNTATTKDILMMMIVTVSCHYGNNGDDVKQDDGDGNHVVRIRITFCFISLFLPSLPPLLMGITKLPICLIAHWGCLKLPRTCTYNNIPFSFSPRQSPPFSPPPPLMICPFLI